MEAKSTITPTYAIFQNASEQEERAHVVVGKFPEWLEGVLYRTGPGHYNSSFEIKHWFDGKALNHRFWISDKKGIVGYRSRFDCSDGEKKRKKRKPSTVTFTQSYDNSKILY